MSQNDPRRLPLPQDPRSETQARWEGAVLLSNEIRYYSTSDDINKARHLIVPFSEEHLEAARYNLTLGPEYRLGGEEIRRLDASDDHYLVIPPHQVAILSTREEITLPRFLVARWNLKVPRVYQGLLWTGALQVDPGWSGRLTCPVYNLSNNPVELQLDDEMFAMDFVKTTAYGNNSEPYNQHRKPVTDYMRPLTSAPFDELQRIDSIENGLRTFPLFVFTILAVIIATITLLPVLNGIGTSDREATEAAAFPISGLALGLAIASAVLSVAAMGRRGTTSRVASIAIPRLYLFGGLFAGAFALPLLMASIQPTLSILDYAVVRWALGIGGVTLVALWGWLAFRLWQSTSTLSAP